MKRTIALLAALVLVLSLAAGCGSPSPSSTPAASPTASAPASTAPASTAPTTDNANIPTIDWHVDHAPQPDNQAMNDALNAYIEPLIGCKVNIHFYTPADYQNKVSVMVSSGQDFGIVAYGGDLPYLTNAQAGAFYPMDKLFATDAPKTKALFPDSTWGCMTVNGNIYGIPSLKDNCYIISMLYNKTLADKIGVTQDELNSFTYFGDPKTEQLLNDIMDKRDAALGKLPEPLFWYVQLETPYWFACENFLGWDTCNAVACIPGINDFADHTNPDDVFNLYATPEYKAACEARWREVQRGIFLSSPDEYNTSASMQFDGNVFGFPGWGYTYVGPDLFSTDWEAAQVMSNRLWTDSSNFYGAGNAIAANCKYPDKAMQFLELVNNDPTVATMLRFGVEGLDYKLDSNGDISFDGTNNADKTNPGNYYWYGSNFGNLTIVKAPPSLSGPNNIMLTTMAEDNQKALPAAHMGFVLNTDPISSEIAACNNVVAQYKDMLRYGSLSSQAEVDAKIDEFNAALMANGEQKILDEIKTQLAAWEASK